LTVVVVVVFVIEFKANFAGKQQTHTIEKKKARKTIGNRKFCGRMCVAVDKISCPF